MVWLQWNPIFRHSRTIHWLRAIIFQTPRLHHLFLYPSATLHGSSSWAGMSGARSPSNRLHLHRPREPSRVHAGECAPSAQRARGLFGRVSSRHGAARKDARPQCLSLTRPITTVSHPCQRQRRAKKRAALNPRDPTSIQSAPQLRWWGRQPIRLNSTHRKALAIPAVSRTAPQLRCGDGGIIRQRLNPYRKPARSRLPAL